MDSAKYNEASALIRKTITFDEQSLSLIDKYYLYSFEAEILYYSALSEPGINSSLKAREIARILKNKHFEGSSENFLGLFYLNKKKYEIANSHFHTALKLLPNENNEIWLSRRYHVLGNLGESFLGFGNADSANIYARMSLDICRKEGNTRGMALACWNIAEAFLIKEMEDSANLYIRKGLNLCEDQKSLTDVKLFLLSSSLKLKVNDNINALELGMETEKNPYASNFSRLEFLNSAIKYHEKNENYQDAYALQKRVNIQRNTLQLSEDSLRLTLLENYYINENKLRAEKESRIRTELEIKSGRYIIIALFSLSAALVSIILTYRFRQKQKNKIRELEFKKEKEEMRLAREAGEYKSKLDAIDSERNRIGRELHDDIGSAMSSLNIFAGLALTNIDTDPEKSKQLLNKINNHANQISENLSDLIWAVYSKNDTYGHLIQRMKNFCFEILAAKGIDPVFSFSSDLQHIPAGLEIRKNLLLLFKEAVNNIAKHSNATKAEFTFKHSNDELMLIISDNGIGFNTNQNQDGNGTTTMKARSRAMHGSVKLESSPGKGTQIIVSFKDSNVLL
jgi:signal transduction histidine kinase